MRMFVEGTERNLNGDECGGTERVESIITTSNNQAI
jgi:hypothetical protein